MSLKLIDLFAKNPNRFSEFSVNANGLLFDYSKQLIAANDVSKLCEIAKNADISSKIDGLFNGAIVNETEKRKALHTELRNPNTNDKEIIKVLDKIDQFVRNIQDKYTDVVVLGIGGSDLGPRLVCSALSMYRTTKLNIHFVANVDGDTLIPLLESLNPKTTFCIINSKTFTTIETLSNAKIVKDWLGNDNLAAVTANSSAAKEWGIIDANIFEFWDWVGGRFSVWSAVGLPIALTIGMDNFKKFLSGANAMDTHFKTAPLDKNMPVLMALIGIHNINNLNYQTLAIMPYLDGLELLPDYLQQLEMESNGKAAKVQTAPVIWGGVGCNGQHAYMQMLHQGTQVVPVDFLVATKSIKGPQELQDLLVASCLGQSQALMQGRKSDESYKACPGNRPSTTIMFEQMTPEIMGNIIALYEHKVFVQGVIWGINSFDQWGVQLGKDLIKDLLKEMRGCDTSGLDSSTVGLLKYYNDNI